MKKLLIFIAIFAFMFSISLGVAAAEATPDETPEETIPEGENTTAEENAREGEDSGDSGIAEPQDVTPISAQILAFLEQHIDSASITAKNGRTALYCLVKTKYAREYLLFGDFMV